MGLFLNGKKTVCVQQGQCQNVTGIVVNDGLNISSEYRKKLRQEIYFCKKYGMMEHLKKMNSQDTVEEYHRKLLGRVNYVLSVTPENAEMLSYKRWLKAYQAGLVKPNTKDGAGYGLENDTCDRCCFCQAGD